MALHYNLAKVYDISDNDSDFVLDIINLFVTEIPADMKNLKHGIKEKDFKKAYAYAHKIKPTLDMLGMKMAYEEILLVEDWTRREGKKKEIKETYKNIAEQVEKAVKEISKDFNLQS
ncbi:Hpt domain-containing protein [uncultured Flavobacterium sp.]|uniref:Hpt domain-containing protein n=1 Tax=uncultured Flavobacterium sp. TaxID=165435 RepID=UPI0025D626B8|nr:Hpt domain-containing protein [uncultured Flavobacterium sp.]